MANIDITAVIVNYNAGSFLQACLQSVLPQVSKVVVVDNGSVDKSVTECMQCFSQEKKLVFILNKGNLGFSRACNQGLKEAKGSHVLFLNPDCYLEKDSLVALMKPLLDDSTVGMVGGRLLNTDGTEQAGGRRAIPTPWRAFTRAFGLYKLSSRWPRLFFDYNLHKQPLPLRAVAVEAISGACMLVSTEAISDVGSWDEGYFLHCEDLDWCLRFGRKGWKIMFAPSAIVTHALGVCSKARPVFVEWHKHKGMIRFYRKFFCGQYFGLLLWPIMLAVWVHFFLVVSHHAVKRLGAKRGS